jgi:hypothetical protein
MLVPHSGATTLSGPDARRWILFFNTRSQCVQTCHVTQARSVYVLLVLLVLVRRTSPS